MVGNCDRLRAERQLRADLVVALNWPFRQPEKGDSRATSAISLPLVNLAGSTDACTELGIPGRLAA